MYHEQNELYIQVIIYFIYQLYIFQIVLTVTAHSGK